MKVLNEDAPMSWHVLLRVMTLLRLEPTAHRPRPKGVRVLPTLLVVGLLVAGCSTHQGGQPATRAGSQQTTSPATATTSTWTPPVGTTAVPEPIGYALVSADGRAITVRAFGGGCTRSAHLAAVESVGQVVLHLDGYSDAAAGGPCLANALVFTQSVTLHAPLGQRQLHDAATGQQVPYFDGRQLVRVTWLPPGAGKPGDTLDGPGWARTYLFAGQPAQAPISVAQVHGDVIGREEFQPNPMVEVTSTSVHGHPARLITQNDGARQLVQDRLVWQEAGYTFFVMSMPSHTPQRPFPPNVLQRVAEGLHLP